MNPRLQTQLIALLGLRPGRAAFTRARWLIRMEKVRAGVARAQCRWLNHLLAKCDMDESMKDVTVQEWHSYEEEITNQFGSATIVRRVPRRGFRCET